MLNVLYELKSDVYQNNINHYKTVASNLGIETPMRSPTGHLNGRKMKNGL